MNEYYKVICMYENIYTLDYGKIYYAATHREGVNLYIYTERPIKGVIPWKTYKGIFDINMFVSVAQLREDRINSIFESI